VKNLPNGHANGHGNGLKADDLHKPAPTTAVVVSTGGEQIKALSDSPLRFIAPSHTGIDILKLLAELEEIIDKSNKVMGVMLRFDEDRFHMTVMKIRANLPEEMKRASKLMQDSERIVQETKQSSDKFIEDARKGAQLEIERGKAEAARLKEQALAEIAKEREALSREAVRLNSESKTAAEQAIVEARKQASKLVSESDIVRTAESQARETRARADADAAATRKGANEYAASVLAKLQQTLGKVSAEIDRGREVLEKRD
jgi:hypothetical protein